MNGAPLIDLVLLAVAVGAVIWAMAERAKGQRALGELTRAGTSEEAVKAQAALAAGAVADALVKRASDSFDAQQTLAQTRLEAQLKPMADTLAKFEQKVSEADAAREREAGAFRSQIDQLLQVTGSARDEARRLATALKRGAGVQGRWGEQMLRNVLELAGMRAGSDFFEQVSVSQDGQTQRPDVIVKLPGAGVFVIDAKCSFAAYLEAQEASDEAAREAAYQRHAASVKAHMQTLAGKAYWEQFEAAPDFVVMFIPGDAFLSAAQERLPELHTQAMEKRVILTTPSSLFALCKAVVYGWRAQEQSLNAKEIAALGRELHKRLATMGRHVSGLGKSLSGAVASYNEFVGSLERQVMTQARKFETLKADAGAPLAESPLIEETPRGLVKLAAEELALTPLEAAPTSGQ